MLNIEKTIKRKRLGLFTCLVFVVCLFSSIVFAGCDIINKPKLAPPRNVSVENGIIKFERADNDEYYILDINGESISIFPNVKPYVEIYASNGINYLEYNANRLFSINDSYTIKLKTCAKNKKDSDWTNLVSYTHSAKMSTPENLAISGKVLTWDVVRNAGLYIVKVITPSDHVVDDDSESVKNNDSLPKYQFSVNRFDFESILSSAGQYRFYVSAVSSDNAYVESDYTNKFIYNYNIQLNQPKGVNVHKVTGISDAYELHMTAILDERANAVKITADDESTIIDINDSSIRRDSETSNLFDINLTHIFKNTGIILDKVKQYTFSIQSLYESQVESFYINSLESNIVSFNNTTRLLSTELEINYNEDSDTYLASWQNRDDDNIIGYQLWIINSNNTRSLRLDRDIKNVVLDDDFLAVGLQVIGRNGYATSYMSNMKSRYTERLTTNFNAQCVGSALIWTEVVDAKYLVEIDDTVFVTDKHVLDLLSLEKKANTVRITIIKEGYEPLSKEINLKYSLLLNTPSTMGGGFNSSNPYLFSFNPVPEAIGYKIYLATKGNKPVAIPRIFTETNVDLSKYLISQGEYSEYSVYIQSVADPMGDYDDSELSGPYKVTHSKVLERPELLKDNNQVVFKSNEAGNDKYTIRFNPVIGANSYEILVNFNRIVVLNDGRTTYYEVDITRFLTTANSYTIMIRALPLDGEEYIKPSSYSQYEYELRQQLMEVTDIRVAETNGKYTVSFALQDNASSYRLRIVKLNDSGYLDYLLSKGLSNIISVQGATDITDYVDRGGEYHIFITAIARTNSYYANSNESKEFGVVNKLTSLAVPTELKYSNVSKNEFLINWLGDEHADYYSVRVENPLGKAKEYTVLNANAQNISDFINIEGNYVVTIKSMVESNSENAKNFTSSAFSEEFIINHIYNRQFDFERASVFYNGDTYDLSIDNIDDLANVLWYHYLFGVDKNYGLELYLNSKDNESTRATIVRLKNEAQDKLLYNFRNDEVWLGLLNNSTDAQLFAHVCRRILESYPEMAILSSQLGDNTVKVSSQMIQDGVKFNLRYWNALSFDEEGNLIEKVDTSRDFINISKDYANDFVYIDAYSRRNVNSPFDIDSYPEMEVETTEQLLMAVQFGKKPVFTKTNTVAEKVYKNAKSVLVAIVGRNYSDIEKVDAIFSWLEYAYNVNYDAKLVMHNNNVVTGSLSEYGIRKEFYLEGIFQDINTFTNNGSDGEFYLGNKNATSESLSKAFSLMCAIEGIKTRKVNGTITYSDVIASHSWNKVYLNLQNEGNSDSWSWYNVDVTYSDNRFIYNKLNNNADSYNMASHLYFLVSDSYLENNVNFGDTTSIPVRYEEKHNAVLTPSEEIGVISHSYNYYGHSSFAMSYPQITSTLNVLNIGSGITGFKYLKEYVYDETGGRYYQRYASTSGYNELQSFVLNAAIMAKYNLLHNEQSTSVMEFRVSGKYLTGGDLTGDYAINKIINEGLTRYWRTNEPNGFNPIVKRVYDSSQNVTTFVLALEWR